MVQLAAALDVLLPGADDRTLTHARNVVHFLRLLSNDASARCADVVGVGLEEARGELERQDRFRVEHALCDLLRHHLAAVASTDTFFFWGEASLDHPSAWRVLDEFRGELPWLACVPAPGERPLDVAARILESLSGLDPGAPEVRLWAARIARFAEGPRPAEKLFRAQLLEAQRAEPPHGPAHRLVAALAAGVAECLLDRGAVREARAWLVEHRVLTDGDARLRQLLAWALICLGDYSAAKNAVLGLAPWSGTLPAGLAGLRAHRPEWLPCLAGKAPAERARTGGDVRVPSAVRDRLSLGASVLGVFAVGREGEFIPLFLETAPALRERVRAWLREREGACAVAGECEHQLALTARTVVVHREGERPVPGALGGENTRAMALAPVLDDEGELAGWVHLECEHHLLPGTARLERIAGGWRGTVLSSAARARDAESNTSSRPEPRPATETARDEDCACVEVFEQLVSDLGIKTVQRRWSGFLLEAGRPRGIATGGEAAGLSDRPGRGRALARALATRGRVLFEEPDPRLALDEQAGSGAVLTLAAAGVVCGLLAIESSRRRDFRESDLERYVREAEHSGLSLRVAEFRGWHRRRFGFDVWLDATRGDFRAFSLNLLAAARSRSPVVLAGPAGVGKRVLARWVHFESRVREGPIWIVAGGSSAASKACSDLLDSANAGTLLLTDVDLLEPDSQEQLIRRLEDDVAPARREARSVRLVATTRTELERAVAAGRMRHDLAQRLDRLQFRLPPVSERREDILPLVACLSRRLAEEENVRPPVFEDEALALLWRQSWVGNVRELESFVYKLVLLGRGGTSMQPTPIEPAQIVDIAARFCVPLVRRLPSRHPARTDLLAALRVTRKAGGRLNKTRAALYLGWDPDTLVARMQDAGIGEEVRDEDAWTSVPPTPPEEPPG